MIKEGLTLRESPSENHPYKSADFVQNVLQYNDPGIIFLKSNGNDEKKKHFKNPSLSLSSLIGERDDAPQKKECTISPEFAFDMGIRDLLGDLQKVTKVGSLELSAVKKEIESEVKGIRGKPNWRLALHQLETSFFTITHKENVPPKKEIQTASQFEKPTVKANLQLNETTKGMEDIFTFVFRKTQVKPKVHQLTWDERFQAGKFKDKQKMLRKALVKAFSYANLHHDVVYDEVAQKRKLLNIIPEVLKPFVKLDIPEGQQLENLFGHQALKWLGRLQTAGKAEMAYPSLKGKKVESLDSFMGYYLLNLHVFRENEFVLKVKQVSCDSKQGKEEAKVSQMPPSLNQPAVSESSLQSDPSEKSLAQIPEIPLTSQSVGSSTDTAAPAIPENQGSDQGSTLPVSVPEQQEEKTE